MANTYTQIYIHIVFWITNNFIDESFSDELYAYICGIIKAKGHKLLAIGGTSNHIHLLIGLNPDQAISQLVKDVKVNSTNFIKQKKFLKCKFNWQVGYGGFSYSKSHVKRVINYIRNQKEHHRKKTFKEEYISMLKSFGVNYNEKYVI